MVKYYILFIKNRGRVCSLTGFNYVMFFVQLKQKMENGDKLQWILLRRDSMLKDKRKRIWAWILAGVLLTESMHPSTANAAQIPKEILTDENTADTQQPKEKDEEETAKESAVNENKEESAAEDSTAETGVKESSIEEQNTKSSIENKTEEESQNGSSKDTGKRTGRSDGTGTGKGQNEHRRTVYCEGNERVRQQRRWSGAGHGLSAPADPGLFHCNRPGAENRRGRAPAEERREP